MSTADDSDPRVPTVYRDDGVPAPRVPKEPLTLWQRATYRWTAITAVMATLLVIYTQHPYYKNGGQFAPFRSFYPVAFVLWLALGLFYVRATLLKFKGTRFTMRDSGLHLILLAKSLERRGSTPGSSGRISRAAAKGTLAAIGFIIVTSALRVAFHLPNTFQSSIAASLGLAPDRLGIGVGIAVQLAFGAVVGAVYRWRVEQNGQSRFWKMAKKPRLRTTLLGIVVKAFYMPLMIGFFSGHANGIAEAWLRHKQLPGLKFVVSPGYPWQQALSWFEQMRARLPDFIPTSGDFSGFFAFGAWTRADWNWGLGVAYDITFFIDCGWALIGYGLESRWLGNKTRSVEPTALGWAAALSCYPPYNNVLGTYLPLENGPQWEFFKGDAGEVHSLWVRGIIVVLFFVYATATVAFGFKFSNLTNRGIVSRGPYRVIRHPAYVCKCTAWWLEHLPTMTLTKAFFLSLLCGVYALRAWTEERHLSMDPDYLAYKKKVPWRIIPGVF